MNFKEWIEIEESKLLRAATLAAGLALGTAGSSMADDPPIRDGLPVMIAKSPSGPVMLERKGKIVTLTVKVADIEEEKKTRKIHNNMFRFYKPQAEQKLGVPLAFVEREFLEDRVIYRFKIK